MRKSIKYAGTVAVALLAVAPIIPTTFTAIVVKAADTTKSDEDTDEINQAKTFLSQFNGNIDVKAHADDILPHLESLRDMDEQTNNFQYFGTPNPLQVMDDVIGNEDIESLMTTKLDPDQFYSVNTNGFHFTAKFNTLDDADTTAYGGSIADENLLKDTAQFESGNTRSMQLTAHITPSADSTDDLVTPVSFVLYKTATEAIVPDLTDLTTTDAASKLSDTSGYSLLKQTTPSFDTSYYKGEKLSTSANPVNNGKLVAGTYYQKVTFAVPKRSLEVMYPESKDTTASLYAPTVVTGEGTGDDVKSTVTFVRKIVIKASNTATSTIPTMTAKPGSSSTSKGLDTNATLTDSTSTDSIAASSSFDNTRYYDTSLNAQSILDDDTTATTAGVSGDKFVKPGSYYRKVTFKLNDGVDGNDYDFGTTPHKVSTDGSEVTFLQTVTVGNNTVVSPISTTVPSVNANTATTADALNLKATSLVNGQGDSVADSVTFGPFTDNKDGSGTQSDSIVNGKFTKAGMYYRTITYTLKDGVKDTNDFPGGTVNGNTVSYVQAVNVKNIPNKPSGSHSNSSTDTDTDNNQWSYHKENGIVTTKTNKSFYILDNEADDAVVDRALGANTSWKTNGYRINKAGVKQYRVSTDEWINADDVNYDQPAVATGLTDIQSIKKIVNINGASPFYYLYTKDGKLVTNRALSKDSSWFTDYQAQDNAGNTYYRVSTDEWVKQINGVTLF
ncbi:hypothetical protein [Companilactobacillus kimchiensis]|uniref:Surface layer protein A domain-containing protein n=1 Tax=Companilactobacillus kimchiensis TaxID=993692 RepID=A0A0R2LEP1_9LACO|nr:hypothetical protein [Companilactobacillus kimchiensis]KRO00118.1 hypothetical protein IV57_GL002134 [Companilactobacillus kimchiensis]